MSTIQLVVNARPIAFRERRPATGEIWLMIAGLDFPGRCWNDFVVVLLTAWIRALRRLVTEDSSEEIVYFMDGPFAVGLSLVKAGMLELRALQGSSRSVQIARGLCPTDDFIQQVSRHAEAVLRAEPIVEGRSTDTQFLEYELDELRKIG